ncbi:MAG: hypothetical protein JWM02_3054 [Frankiales bacterium]|nr:hypothetical protein [Frankiales bacterium]
MNEDRTSPASAVLGFVTELQSLLLDGHGLDAFLAAAAGLLAALTHPKVLCAISLPAGGPWAGLGANCPRAARLHQKELTILDGPTHQALRRGAVVYQDDVDQLGSKHCSLLGRHHVASVLSMPLLVEGRTVGVSTLYAGRSLGTDEVRDVLVAGHATATALVVRLRAEEQARVNDQLRQAAASRPVIDQALGIMMGSRGCTASEAFDLLRVDSQAANQPVREIAAGLVVAATGRAPEVARPFMVRTPRAGLRWDLIQTKDSSR